MLKSFKFWIPVAISCTLSTLILLYALGNMWAPSQASEKGETVARAVFPYGFTLLGLLDYLWNRGFDVGGTIYLVVIVIAFLGQFPLYGALIGYGLERRRLILMVIVILAFHTLFFSLSFLLPAGS